MQIITSRIDPEQVTTQTIGSAPLTGAPLAVHRLWLGQKLVDYRAGWQLQRDLHAQVVSGKRPDTLLLLEHRAVFTAGSRTQPEDRPSGTTDLPVLDVDRGGRITWHGPGQLVGYPIVRLPGRLDVVAYVRAIEDLIMRVCAELGVPVSRVPGRSGVWVLPKSGRNPGVANKIAAIGVRVAKGVTMHGFALNCDCDLSWAGRIVPCGLADAGVTSLSREVGKTVSTSAAADVLVTHLEPTTKKETNR